MGYKRHHTIAVTSWDEKAITDIYTIASVLFRVVSPIMVSPTNAYWTFFVPPDGSKEGWPESNIGDAARAGFVKALEETCLDWVEVQYGDEDGDNRLLAAS